MTFIKKEIKPNIIAIVDVWTYKIRAWICKIINRDVELIWYWEKRQDENFIIMQEIQDLEWVSENIKQAILKAQKDWNIEAEEIILNLPSSDLFFEFSKINYLRENEDKINEKELYKIMEYIESKALKKHYKNINENSWYKKNELKLIISNVSNLLLDREISNNIIWNKAKEINISLLNIFTTESKYEITKYIENSIWKKVINIIPSEFAITWLFNNKKNLVIIDLWNSHTSIIIKKNWVIAGAKKLTFGINDLIKQIRKNYNLTKNDIIETIDLDRFTIEKSEFLSIFIDILSITIEEILEKEICPNDFFIIWWWANKFIKVFLKNIDPNQHNLKIAWKINFVVPQIDFIDDKIENNPDWVDSAKSNINIFAMIKTTLDFIKKDKDKIQITLQKVIKDLWK